MAKLERKKGTDVISELPDGILSHILSFLSIEEAVQTSILSTRWRFLFKQVTNLILEFDEEKGLQLKNKEFFVDDMLSSNSTRSIEKFFLQYRNRSVDSSRVYGWLNAAFSRGVQHLGLEIKTDTLTLPNVMCRKLVSLKLGVSFLLKVPNGFCFPNLKILYLEYIEFQDDDSVQRLLKGCINLEELWLEYCILDKIRKLTISHKLLKSFSMYYAAPETNLLMVFDAPNLVNFHYRTIEPAGAYSLKMPGLVRAWIDGVLRSYDPHEADFTDFFRGINNVQRLNLSTKNLQILLCCESIPVFPNLVQLNVSCVGTLHLGYYPLGKGYAALLRDWPELHHLNFFQEVVYYLPQKVHSSLLFNVKEIEIQHLWNDERCIAMAKYFLKHARKLESLTIRELGLPIEAASKVIAEELLASPRLSKRCRIMVV